MNGTLSFGGTLPPKNEASSANLQRTLRTISPKYIPDIIFSKICENQPKNSKEQTYDYPPKCKERLDIKEI